MDVGQPPAASLPIPPLETASEEPPHEPLDSPVRDQPDQAVPEPPVYAEEVPEGAPESFPASEVPPSFDPADLEPLLHDADPVELPPEELAPVLAPEPASPAPTAQRSAPSTLSAPPPLPPLPAGPRTGGRSSKGAGAPAGRSFARIAALTALAAVVVVAVVLLVHSLASSKKEKPQPAPAVVKVLIPEGKTRAQIAEIAKAAGLVGSYRAAAKSSALLNPAHYGAPKDTPDLEGFLFPATYELDRGTQVSQLVHEQIIAFQENFKSEYFRRAKALHVSAYQLLIVASMIEREAQVSGDRAKIAAVIYNRLADGMPLGIDASIYYAVEEQQHIATYTHELTESQLHIDSPYNTRTHTGLPPTPISNPGVASIKAAAHPAHVAYLYYVAGADGCGEQVFSDTLTEFEANAAAYEAAVKRNGGHPPACKHH